MASGRLFPSMKFQNSFEPFSFNGSASFPFAGALESSLVSKSAMSPHIAQSIITSSPSYSNVDVSTCSHSVVNEGSCYDLCTVPGAWRSTDCRLDSELTCDSTILTAYQQQSSPPGADVCIMKHRLINDESRNSDIQLAQNQDSTRAGMLHIPGVANSKHGRMSRLLEAQMMENVWNESVPPQQSSSALDVAQYRWKIQQMSSYKAAPERRDALRSENTDLQCVIIPAASQSSTDFSDVLGFSQRSLEALGITATDCPSVPVICDPDTVASKGNRVTNPYATLFDFPLDCRCRTKKLSPMQNTSTALVDDRISNIEGPDVSMFRCANGMLSFCPPPVDSAHDRPLAVENLGSSKQSKPNEATSSQEPSPSPNTGSQPSHNILESLNKRKSGRNACAICLSDDVSTDRLEEKTRAVDEYVKRFKFHNWINEQTERGVKNKRPLHCRHVSRRSRRKPARESSLEEVIHVRARPGQATDSHSLAERMRRERISQRMKVLQDLVPGCNKVLGKVMRLDEIINYVQFLQQQVEFLSRRVAAANLSQGCEGDGLSFDEICAFGS